MEPTDLVPDYQQDDTIKLDITESHHDTISSTETVTAHVAQVITATMSPVMLVKLKPTSPHAPNRAILKLYDRGDRRTELLPNSAADWRLEPGGQAKFEAALWWEARSHFEAEVDAYKRLKELQGVFIPRMYASVRLSSSSASVDMSEYYSVNGILLQFISGWSLDSCPRKVVVDADSHQPFIIDLAQCYFKDQLFKVWEHFGFGEGQEDWTPEAKWCESVRCRDNPGSMGLPMQSKLRRVKGFLIDVKYPE
ncbi:kinase-like domain protein [Fusarium sp. NRRL 52700]|nr:kinase-like domain protein [Fusarium sp. NRRL 52700]